MHASGMTDAALQKVGAKMKSGDEKTVLVPDAHCKKQFLCSARYPGRLFTLRQARTSRAKNRHRHK